MMSKRAKIPLTYGQRMLAASLKGGVDKPSRKRRTKKLDPQADATLWCEAGCDKDGFEVQYISDYKGFGVFATKEHSKGEFLLEYKGESISIEEAKERERKSVNPENMMFFFHHKGKQHCIDASGTTNHICQYVNDTDKKNANCIMKITETGDTLPRLCLFALKNILQGEELLYDYGDRKEHLWWRKPVLDTHDDYDDDDDPFDISQISDISSEAMDSADEMGEEGMLEACEIQQPMVTNGDQTFTGTGKRALTGLDETMFNGANKTMPTGADETMFTGTDETMSTGADETMFTGTDETIPTDANKTMFTGADETMPTGTDETMFTATDETIPTGADKTMFTGADETIPTGMDDTMLSAMEEENDKNQEQQRYQATETGKMRPHRMCPYCNKLINGGKLKRHIISCHKHEKEVTEILKKTEQEQSKFFEQKRTEGMYQYNMQKLAEGSLMRERKSKTPDELRLCMDCKKFISNRTFYKHKKWCRNSIPIKPKMMRPILEHRDSDYVVKILNKFRDGDVGNYIRSHEFIQMVGYRHYSSRKSEQTKSNEVRKEIMGEMRELTRLFLTFRSLSKSEVSFESMYTREHLQVLREAIDKHCQKTDDNGPLNKEKHGLKIHLNGVFQRSIGIISGHYSQTKQDQKRKELKKFHEAYNFSLPEIIGKARYKSNQNSLKKARLPKNLPLETEMKLLKGYVASELNFLTSSEFTMQNYVWLRSLLVTRLTLYNARRGEEVSRLTTEEYNDALKGTWVPKEQVEKLEDIAERYLVGQFKLAYLGGKGKGYVPILIPLDLMPALQLLYSKRLEFGVPTENKFLFATRSTDSHCSGWHALQVVCRSAGISVNATKNRHRASTIYASLDMTESNRRIFFDHLGHKETINKENYQCPPGLNEIRVMGQFLNGLDDGVQQSIPAVALEPAETVASQSGRQNCSSARILTEISSRSPAGTSDDIATEAPAKISSPAAVTISPIPKQKSCERAFIRWSEEETKSIHKDFKEWIEAPAGNKLPSKKVLVEYLRKTNWTCSLLQLRSKIMNEQNKRQRMSLKAYKQLECQQT